MEMMKIDFDVSSEKSSDKSTITTEDEKSVDGRSDRSIDERSDRSIDEDRSERSMDEEDRSDRSTEEENESYITVTPGRKRKSLDCGPSSDSDDYDSSDEEEEDDGDNDNEERPAYPDSEAPVQFLNGDGVPATDEEILDWMDGSSLTEEECRSLIPKLRRYFRSLQDSKGYKCTDFPGHIRGVTSVEPRSHVIEERDRYPEGYNQFLVMASLAIRAYNRKTDSEYVVKLVEDATMTFFMDYVYKITFTASDMQSTLVFRAQVKHCIMSVSFTVLSCYPETSSYESTEKQEAIGEDEQHDAISFLRNYGEKDEWLRPIFTLRSFSGNKILDLIEHDQRCAKKDEIKLAKKVRKYLDSICKSEGFECTHFPGHILGLPMVKPRQKIINERNRFCECYSRFQLMATLAIDGYYKDKNNEAKVGYKSIESVNSYENTYYITFTGSGGYHEEKFQAVVRDHITCMDLLMCRKVSNCSVTLCSLYGFCAGVSV